MNKGNVSLCTLTGGKEIRKKKEEKRECAATDRKKKWGDGQLACKRNSPSIVNEILKVGQKSSHFLWGRWGGFVRVFGKEHTRGHKSEG